MILEQSLSRGLSTVAIAVRVIYSLGASSVFREVGIAKPLALLLGCGLRPMAVGKRGGAASAVSCGFSGAVYAVGRRGNVC